MAENWFEDDTVTETVVTTTTVTTVVTEPVAKPKTIIRRTYVIHASFVSINM